MMFRSKTALLWLLWLSLTLLVASVFAYRMALSDEKSMFLVGDASHGHYQIELACEGCHTEAFGGQEVLQDACINCHGEELRAAHDSHPKKKFTDPRNSDRIAILDARYCASCHVEHQSEKTGDMGLTLPEDFCYQCHKDVAKNRPSHEGMAFDSCADAGCHNYHDNRALYEDFLVKHANDPELAERARVPVRNALEHYLATLPEKAQAPLNITTADGGPRNYLAEGIDTVVDHWQTSDHAAAGVNCSGCHQPTMNGASDTQWQDKPSTQVCMDCHQNEVRGFKNGKHGMQLASLGQNIRPETARLPFKDSAASHEQGCIACHNGHAMAVATAAVGACLGCHNDEHSLAYEASPHHRLWQAEQAGDAPEGSGVSCATCHLPRLIEGESEHARVRVQHNQNDNLRPNEKMIRPVCMNCHSLAFAIDALADPALVRSNFSGQPASHVRSIDMAVERAR